MNILTEFWTRLNDIIIWEYLFTVIIFVYFIKWVAPKSFNWWGIRFRYIVLIIAFILCAVFYVFWTPMNWANYLITYMIATSMYDMLLKKFLPNK